jgi:acetate kinase
MDDYALVFNAGSSSLKFCVYSRPAEEGWGLKRVARSTASARRPASR